MNPEEQNITGPGWRILEAIDEFNRAARERIMDAERWDSQHRTALVQMRDALNAIEIRLRDLVGEKYG